MARVVGLLVFVAGCKAGWLSISLSLSRSIPVSRSLSMLQAFSLGVFFVQLYKHNMSHSVWVYVCLSVHLWLDLCASALGSFAACVCACVGFAGPYQTAGIFLAALPALLSNQTMQSQTHKHNTHPHTHTCTRSHSLKTVIQAAASLHARHARVCARFLYRFDIGHRKWDHCGLSPLTDASDEYQDVDGENTPYDDLELDYSSDDTTTESGSLGSHGHGDGLWVASHGV